MTLPPLPEPDTHCFDDDTRRDVWSYSERRMRAYAEQAVAAEREERAMGFQNQVEAVAELGSKCYRQREALHVAVCQAVALLNRAPEVARCAEGREARDLLRKVLADYADAYMDDPATEDERAAVAAKHQQPSRSKRLLAAGFKPRPRLPSDE